jgi:high-affinity nickel-transport protein
MTFDLGLLITALGFGLRHGIDWDHIAAITDLAGSQTSRRRSMVLATLYILGHAAVIIVLGVAAIAFSERLPSSVDDVMERVVGITLVALGVYVLVGLVRYGRGFRMRSRWMVVIAAARRFGRWAARRPPAEPVVIEHEHEHEHDVEHEHSLDELRAHDHVHERVPARVTVGGGGTTHRHPHRHLVAMPDDPFFDSNARTAVGIGIIHGIGAETPTQVLVFIAAAGAGGTDIGIMMLLAFVVGLVISNTAIALAATFGYLGASRNFAVFATVSVVTAAFSLALGVLCLLGRGAVLPEFFSG